jgi:predicted GNAT family N-acyltransferase
MQPPARITQLIDPADLRRVHDLRFDILRKPMGLPYSSAVFAEDVQPTTTHYLALVEDELVGCVSLVESPEQRRTQLRGMAVRADHQNRGIGRLLLQHLQTPQLLQSTNLWCNARQAAVGFYERNGWVTVGDCFDIPHIGPHIKMEWRQLVSTSLGDCG